MRFKEVLGGFWRSFKGVRSCLQPLDCRLGFTWGLQGLEARCPAPLALRQADVMAVQLLQCHGEAAAGPRLASGPSWGFDLLYQ